MLTKAYFDLTVVTFDAYAYVSLSKMVPEFVVRLWKC